MMIKGAFSVILTKGKIMTLYFKRKKVKIYTINFLMLSKIDFTHILWQKWYISMETDECDLFNIQLQCE